MWHGPRPAHRCTWACVYVVCAYIKPQSIKRSTHSYQNLPIHKIWYLKPTHIERAQHYTCKSFFFFESTLGGNATPSRLFHKSLWIKTHQPINSQNNLLMFTLRSYYTFKWKIAFGPSTDSCWTVHYKVQVNPMPPTPATTTSSAAHHDATWR